MNEFLFATGIECAYPRVPGVGRRDMLDESGHYVRWKEDLALVKEIGCTALRYGPPFHRINTGAGRYDWSFTDDVFREMQRLELLPIVDMLHFGLPDWLGDFQKPEFPAHFARYAANFAKRYPWVQWYTPVNEILMCAESSTILGFWNEAIKTHKAFVTALKHLCQASILMMEEVSKIRKDAVFVQSESAQYRHVRCRKAEKQADFYNQLRFVALDLHYSRQVNGEMLMYMMDNGLTRDEYQWFMESRAGERAVLGIDYYRANEGLINEEGEKLPYCETLGWYVIAMQYYQRYQRPLMQSETNVPSAEDAPQWLWKLWHNVYRLRADGVPVVGFTWWGLVDLIDWENWLQEKKNEVVPSGLYDLARTIRPVGKEYKALICEYAHLPILKQNPIFGIGDGAGSAPPAHAPH